MTSIEGCIILSTIIVNNHGNRHCTGWNVIHIHYTIVPTCNSVRGVQIIFIFVVKGNKRENPPTKVSRTASTTGLVSNCVPEIGIDFSREGFDEFIENRNQNSVPFSQYLLFKFKKSVSSLPDFLPVFQGAKHGDTW